MCTSTYTYIRTVQHPPLLLAALGNWLNSDIGSFFSHNESNQEKILKGRKLSDETNISFVKTNATAPKNT